MCTGKTMWLLLLMLFVFSAILCENTPTLKPNYCQIQEEYFEYVPKTITLRERKDRTENKGILSYFNPKNFFRKDEFQNVAKTVMVAEKQVRTVTECCRGFVQVKGDCVPKEGQEIGKKAPSTAFLTSTPTVPKESKVNVSETLSASVKTTVVLSQAETSLAVENSKQKSTVSSGIATVTDDVLESIAQSEKTSITDEMKTNLESVSLTTMLITTIMNSVETGSNALSTNKKISTEAISINVSTSEPVVKMTTTAKEQILTTFIANTNSETTTLSNTTFPKTSSGEITSKEGSNTFLDDETTIPNERSSVAESIPSTEVVSDEQRDGSNTVNLYTVSSSSQAEETVTQLSPNNLPEEGNESSSNLREVNELQRKAVTTKSIPTSVTPKRDEVTSTVASFQPDVTVQESIPMNMDSNSNKQPDSDVEESFSQTEQTVAQLSISNIAKNSVSFITVREIGQSEIEINSDANVVTRPYTENNAKEAKREVDFTVDDFPNNDVETDFPRISSTESSISNRKTPFLWSWWLRIFNILRQFLKRMDAITW